MKLSKEKCKRYKISTNNGCEELKKTVPCNHTYCNYCLENHYDVHFKHVKGVEPSHIEIYCEDCAALLLMSGIKCEDDEVDHLDCLEKITKYAYPNLAEDFSTIFNELKRGDVSEL